MAIYIKGKNNSSAKHAFVMRKNYKEFAFPKHGFPASIDFWYDKTLYGRVDQTGNAVLLSEAFLRQIEGTGKETLQAVDFVVEAFHDLVRYYGKLKREGIVRPEGALSDIKAMKAWPTGGVNSMYHLWMKALYNSFSTKYVRTFSRNQKITSFETFMEVFLEYINSITPHFPLTKTGLIISNFCNPMISGLIIEIAKADHGDDRVKNRAFIKDKNFIPFRKAAALHGFMIDKNAPWRLVADLNSIPMEKYMKKYGRNLQKIFTSYYYPSYRGGINFASNDILALKTYIFGFYNSFVNAQPFARETEILDLTDPCSRKTKINKIDRFQITKEEFEEKYGILFWLRFYMYIRAREAEKSWSPNDFNNKATRMINIYKVLDTVGALNYINEQVKPEPLALETKLQKKVGRNAIPSFRQKEKLLSNIRKSKHKHHLQSPAGKSDKNLEILFPSKK